jgi:tetrahydromethanopterin S-methyltransferase subunit G
MGADRFFSTAVLRRKLPPRRDCRTAAAGVYSPPDWSTIVHENFHLVLRAGSGGAVAAQAVSPAPAAPAAAAPTPQDRRIADLAEDLQAAQDRIADLQKRLDEVEQRLGETYRPISPFDTVERRLEDLEKDVEDIQRR